MSSVPIVFGTNSFTPGMRLDSSGNLGIGTVNPNPAITIGTEVLTAEMLKAFKHIHGFIEYVAKTDPSFGELWTAYNTAEKLE